MDSPPLYIFSFVFSKRILPKLHVTDFPAYLPGASFLHPPLLVSQQRLDGAVYAARFFAVLKFLNQRVMHFLL